MIAIHVLMCFFFFNDTATTEIYTLPLHDALPIWKAEEARLAAAGLPLVENHHGDQQDRDETGESRPDSRRHAAPSARRDRESTRLNSSHRQKSYAVFCFEKKKQPTHNTSDPLHYP